VTIAPTGAGSGRGQRAQSVSYYPIFDDFSVQGRRFCGPDVWRGLSRGSTLGQKVATRIKEAYLMLA
jgi:hypothetical protein